MQNVLLTVREIFAVDYIASAVLFLRKDIPKVIAQNISLTSVSSTVHVGSQCKEVEELRGEAVIYFYKIWEFWLLELDAFFC